MADLLTDLEQYFIDRNLVTADGVDIFRDYSPDIETPFVVLSEYSGQKPVPGVTVGIRRVQIAAKAYDAETAKELSWQLYNAIVREEECIDITSTRWAIVSPLQSPFKLDRDDQSRISYGFNLNIVTSND